MDVCVHACTSSNRHVAGCSSQVCLDKLLVKLNAARAVTDGVIVATKPARTKHHPALRGLVLHQGEAGYMLLDKGGEDYLLEQCRGAVAVQLSVECFVGRVDGEALGVLIDGSLPLAACQSTCCG